MVTGRTAAGSVNSTKAKTARQGPCFLVYTIIRPLVTKKHLTCPTFLRMVDLAYEFRL